FMAKRREYFWAPTLTLAQQIGRMSKHHGQFRVGFNRKGVYWRGPLQPSALSETYTLRIEYTPGARPRIQVVEPKLESNPKNEPIPHTFSDASLCLHLPGGWTADTFIAE